jgi:hypothetical protein
MREGRWPDHIASVAANHSAENDGEEFGLERITNDDGRTTLPHPTAIQREKVGRRTGKSIMANCLSAGSIFQEEAVIIIKLPHFVANYVKCLFASLTEAMEKKLMPDGA